MCSYHPAICHQHLNFSTAHRKYSNVDGILLGDKNAISLSINIISTSINIIFTLHRMSYKDLVIFWFQFYIMILGIAFSFFIPSFTFHFLYGLLSPFSIWTFTSLFYLDLFYRFYKDFYLFFLEKSTGNTCLCLKYLIRKAIWCVSNFEFPNVI